MNKVININFQGRVLPIEEQAYELLKQYVESLRKYFSNEEGCDEIINDIECRIAELCDERLKKGEVCITVSIINLIIASIGRPEDFEAQEEHFEGQTHTNASNQSTQPNTSNYDSNKRLYRDAKNKIFGGVCAGIANYFNTDPVVIRLLWIFIPGLNFIAYLILWVVVPASTEKEVGGQRKRFFRDIDNKIIGGVCSGLSKFFGIRVGIIRLLFLLPLIRFIFRWNHLHLFQFWNFPDFYSAIAYSFSPGALFIYIILWLVIPEAKTSADKLEMVGEKVDINSIKNTIQKDLEGFTDRAKVWGEQMKPKKEDGLNENREEHRSGFLYFIGKLIRITVKVFVYFILGVITLAVLSALFGVGVASTSLLPLKAFVLNDTQQWLAIGIIIFFIWVPVVGIIAAVIRKLIGAKKPNTWVRTSFWSLWVLGWVCLPFFFASITKSFSKHNEGYEQTIALTNPKIDYLEVLSSPKAKYYDEKWFELEPFKGMYDEDTVYVRNVRVRIVQSKNDSFSVKYVRLANGSSVQEANAIAEKINFNVSQEDSVLHLDKGIAINKYDKFRNQHVVMTIAVPVGKRIKIGIRGWSQTNLHVNRRGFRDEDFSFGFSDGFNDWYDEWGDRWDNESYAFERGVEYKMTTTGLEKLKRDNSFDDDQQNNFDEEQRNNRSELEDLKRQREEIEQKLKEKEEKHNTSNTSSAIQMAPKVAERVEQARWLLERFTH